MRTLFFSKYLWIILAIVVVTAFSLPLKVIYYGEIYRAEKLISYLDRFQDKYQNLPETQNYELLRFIGFTEAEVVREFPKYQKLSNNHYELIFIEGFDCPYLRWKSKDREWYKGCE